MAAPELGSSIGRQRCDLLMLLGTRPQPQALYDLKAASRVRIGLMRRSRIIILPGMGMKSMKISLMAACVITLMTIAGCAAAPGTQTCNLAPSGPATVSGVQRQWCETTPEIVFQVTSNPFSYPMPHPNAPENPTPVYAATIASDGTFQSILNSGRMTDRVVGTRIPVQSTDLPASTRLRWSARSGSQNGFLHGKSGACAMLIRIPPTSR